MSTYAETIRDAAAALREATAASREFRREVEGIQRAGTAVNQAAAAGPLAAPGVPQPAPNFGTGLPADPTVSLPTPTTRGQGGGDGGAGSSTATPPAGGTGGDGGQGRANVGPVMLTSSDGSRTSSADWVARTCKRSSRKIPNPKNMLSLLNENSDDMVTVEGWDCSGFFGSDVFFYDPASFNALKPAPMGESGTGSGMGPNPTQYKPPALVLGTTRTALGQGEDINAAAGRGTPQTAPSPGAAPPAPNSTTSSSTSSNRSTSMQSAPAAMTLGDKAVVDTLKGIGETLKTIQRDGQRPAVDPFRKAKVLG